MKPRYLPSVAIGAMMLLAAAGAYLLTPSVKLAQHQQAIDLEAAVPKQFGQWVLDPNVVPVSPSADTAELLNKIYDQVLNRTYVNQAGERIMLSIAYGGSQTGQLRAHRQEVCYRAQGFAVAELQSYVATVGGASVKGTRMVARQGNERIEPVTYWFTVGDEVVRSYMDRQLAQLKYAFSGFIPDGYLYRVSSISPDAPLAFRKQEQFTTELMTQIDPRLLRRLVGGGAAPR
jgi:EpsI family protein